MHRTGIVAGDREVSHLGGLHMLLVEVVLST